MAILVFAGVLSVPSAVFAEANWYGSLRGGVTFGGGDDARFMDGNSRWGIKGSNELGEGLSATYRFEHKFSTENAGMTDGEKPVVGEALKGGGRLAYVGLSGGFGSLTLGQIWSASFNATGAITDNSLLWGDSATSYRVGNALSYAVSAGSLSMQIDAVMDSGENTDGALDQLEFGLTVDLGDIGKVAFAHVKKEDTLHQVVTAEAMPEMYYVIQADASDMSNMAESIMVWVTGTDTNVNDGGQFTGDVATIALENGGRYHSTGAATDDCETLAGNADAADDCVQVIAYKVTTTTTTSTAGTAELTTTTTEAFHIAGTATNNVGTIEATEEMSETQVNDPGSKSNHVAVQVALGGVTMHLGQSQKKMNGSGTKTTTTHYGVAGSLGDTGLNYLVQARKVKEGSMSSDPWLLSINRSLGDGATAFIEHANADDGNSGKTWVGLKVDF